MQKISLALLKQQGFQMCYAKNSTWGPFESQVRSEFFQMPLLEAKHVPRFSNDEKDPCYRELKKKIHQQAIFQGASQVQWKRMLAVLRQPHLTAKAISEVSPQRDRWSYG